MKIIKGGIDASKSKQGNGDGHRNPTLHFGFITTSDPIARKLLYLIESLDSGKPTRVEIENLIQFCIAGWNMASFKKISFPDFEQFFNQSMKRMEINGSGRKLVEKIMARSVKDYPNSREVIDSYELKENGDTSLEFEVTYKTMNELMEGSDMEEDELEELQYEAGYINRNALMVRPKETFWKWIKLCYPEFEMTLIPHENKIYLFGETESDAETLKWLKKNFDKIFINEMSEWITDDSKWPERRNYQMFKDFFEVSFHSMVMDLENEPVIKD